MDFTSLQRTPSDLKILLFEYSDEKFLCSVNPTHTIESCSATERRHFEVRGYDKKTLKREPFCYRQDGKRELLFDEY